MDYKLIEKQGRTKGDEMYFLCIPDMAEGFDVTAYYMQTSGNLPWLIPMRYVSYGGRNTFCYDLEGQYPLDMERITHNRDALLETMIEVCEVVSEAERHMIDPLQLIWNWKCIFRGERGLRFIAVPVPISGSKERQLYCHLRSLLEMAGTEVRDTVWFRQIQEYLARTDWIDVRDFRRFLYQLRVSSVVESARTGQTMVLTADACPVQALPDEAGAGTEKKRTGAKKRRLFRCQARD